MNTSRFDYCSRIVSLQLNSIKVTSTHTIRSFYFPFLIFGFSPLRFCHYTNSFSSFAIWNERWSWIFPGDLFAAMGLKVTFPRFRRLLIYPFANYINNYLLHVYVCLGSYHRSRLDQTAEISEHITYNYFAVDIRYGCPIDCTADRIEMLNCLLLGYNCVRISYT